MMIINVLIMTEINDNNHINSTYDNHSNNDNNT